jgi:hypothetical protein
VDLIVVLRFSAWRTMTLMEDPHFEQIYNELQVFHLVKRSYGIDLGDPNRGGQAFVLFGLCSTTNWSE